LGDDSVTDHEDGLVELEEDVEVFTPRRQTARDYISSLQKPEMLPVRMELGTK
jgi:hypothetical protein